MSLSSNTVATWVGSMTAKELFEKLGFTIVDGASDQELVYYKKNANPNENWNFNVVFHLYDRYFQIRDDWGDSYKADVDLLKAITYQVRELGWL